MEGPKKAFVTIPGDKSVGIFDAEFVVSTPNEDSLFDPENYEGVREDTRDGLHEGFSQAYDGSVPVDRDRTLIAFSPTDALEAVEEACNTLLTQLEAIDHNSEVRKEAFKAMREEAKATINQKRKGHE